MPWKNPATNRNNSLFDIYIKLLFIFANENRRGVTNNELTDLWSFKATYSTELLPDVADTY